MLRFGPSGVPLCCKGGLRDGIEDVRNLGLDAMEVQVRAEGSMDGLPALCQLARDLDVQLSVHAPYYMELTSPGRAALEPSMENVKWSAMVAQELDAVLVVTQVGLYAGGKKQTLENAVRNVRKARDWFRKTGIKPKLGLETSGKQRVFGSLDEILAVCKRVNGVVPVLNFAHIHARERGSLKRKGDFEDVFQRVRKVVGGRTFYARFSGVEHRDGDKGRNVPLRRGDLRFEPLADCLLDHPDWDVTVISDSPVLEHDALYMRVVVDRLGKKRRLVKHRP